MTDARKLEFAALYFIVTLCSIAYFLRVQAQAQDAPEILAITHTQPPQSDWIWTITLTRPAPADLTIRATLRTKDKDGKPKTKTVMILKGHAAVKFTLPEFDRVESAVIL